MGPHFCGSLIARSPSEFSSNGNFLNLYIKIFFGLVCQPSKEGAVARPKVAFLVLHCQKYYVERSSEGNRTFLSMI